MANTYTKRYLFRKCDYNRVATWSGKTKKIDKSQVKMAVFEKSQENFLKTKRFKFQITNFIIFRSFPLVKNYSKVL